MSLDGELDLALNEVGPLVWILREVDASLDSARQSLRKYVREQQDSAREGVVADTTNLRAARAQLHQAAGAVEVVGVSGAPAFIKALEAAVGACVEHPEALNVQALAHIEQGMNALREYMQGIVAGRKAQPVRLFLQYAQLLQLSGAERIHPADLWEREFEWRPIDAPGAPAAQALVHQSTSAFDRALLQFLRGQGALAAAGLLPLLAECAAHAQSVAGRCFWSIAAGLAEAVSRQALLANDHIKRAFTRLGLQFRASQSGGEVSERLARDMLFFCANARDIEDSQWLAAVKAAYGLTRYEPVDYTVAHFGALDPAMLKLAQRRVTSLKEMWAELSNGDASRVKSVAESADLVAESLSQLHPGSQVLGDSLAKLVRACSQSAEALTPERALEVANAVLFLEATLSAGEIDAPQFDIRSAALKVRLERALAGTPTGPLEPWMEQMYRGASETQTMGSVVQELKVSLSSAESALDQFFRKHDDRQPLAQVPGLLGQMRGVFSVLGYDDAAHAVADTRTTVENWLLDTEPPSPAACERLAQNVGALSFMIDLMAYQPAAAKALFTFDSTTGEFRSGVKQSVRTPRVTDTAGDQSDLAAQMSQVAAQLSGPDTAEQHHAALTVQLETIRLEAVIADAPELEAAADSALHALKGGDSQEAAKALQDISAAEPAPAAAPAPLPMPDSAQAEEDELRAIFLDEGREVVDTGLQQVARLRQSPGDHDALVTMRRSFHTLKGSSRMVGLNAFGEAAWQMEQTLNGFLADQKPASPAILDLSQDALTHFSRWLEAIAAGGAQPDWVAAITRSADAFRHDGHYLPVDSGQPAAALPVGQPIEIAREGLVDAGVEADLMLDVLPDTPAPAAPVTTLPFLDDLSLDLGTPATAGASAPAVQADEVSMDEFLAVAAAAQAARPKHTAEVIMHPAAEPVPAPEEEVRVVGDLRIPIPLYNIYLNEADELVRRLGTEIDVWRLEQQHLVPEGAIASAHTIAGTSATVGYQSLADLAYDLEAALIACRDHRHVPTAADHAVLEQATEEVRRLLHQFAAGFYKPVSEPVADAVAQLKHQWQRTEVADTTAALAAEPVSAFTPVAAPVEVPPTVVPAAAQALADAAARVAVPDTASAPEAAPAAEQAPLAAPASAVLSTLSPTPETPAPADESERDQVDPDLFPIFEEEGQELLPSLAQALRNWQREPADTQQSKQALRVLHTFKGSARLAGAMRLGDMAHQLESAVEAVLRGDTSAHAITGLVEQADDIVNRFDQLRRGEVHSASEYEFHAPSAEPLLSQPVAPVAQPANDAGAGALVPSFKLTQTAAA
ncbi:MAG: Hpt domain-containing protein, partial [Betaproteobacteria bacterium]|nr:Hpt domain-containing protein [Betaproteobacteria bacterium]